MISHESSRVIRSQRSDRPLTWRAARATKGVGRDRLQAAFALLAFTWDMTTGKRKRRGFGKAARLGHPLASTAIEGAIACKTTAQP
jgi:hypothetical protein